MDDAPFSLRFSQKNPSMTHEEYVQFRDYVERHCSIALGDDKKYLLEARLAGLVVESGCESFREFFARASTSVDPKLRDKIVDAVTTNETLWFRDGSPWELVRDKALPEFASLASTGKRVRFRIWSGACSTGQEPYSLAMLIDDFCKTPGCPLTPEAFEIIATDISPSALFIAMAGRYDAISMKRGLSGDWERYRATYFDKKGIVSEVKDHIKKRVQFKRYNLQDSLAPLGVFDLVFLRNVAIYFSAPFKRDLFQRIHDVMGVGARLLVGSAESLTDYPHLFSPERHGRAFAYRKAGGVGR
jgi:chemotaxis protein methyltransferase CheR